ncbi:MAG: hypothetical protein WCW01_06475 [Gammaproteobacteria bacterium]|jgi:hypothetical protein
MPKTVKTPLPLDAEFSSCFLGISIGPEYYQGESLIAILAFIEKGKFTRGRFAMFADTLDAYNLIFKNPNWTLEYNLDDARKLAAQNGQAWLDSSDGQKLQKSGFWTYPPIAQTPPITRTSPIIRWNEIIDDKDPVFLKAKETIHDLYIPIKDRRSFESKSQDPEVAKKLSFSAAVDRTVTNHILPLKSEAEKGKVVFEESRAREIFTAYVIEECMGEIVIANKFPADYELYPKPMNPAIEWVHGKIISPLHVLSWLTIPLKEEPEAKQKHNANSASPSASSSPAPLSEQVLHPSVVLPSDNTNTTLTSSSTTTGSSVSMQRPLPSNLATAMLKVGQFANIHHIEPDVNAPLPIMSASEIRDDLTARSMKLNGCLWAMIETLNTLSKRTSLSLEEQNMLRIVYTGSRILPTNEQIEALTGSIKKEQHSSPPTSPQKS